MDIWAACRDEARPGRLAGELIRVVESQEQVATNSLVETLEEQALLEQMLEASKPPLPPELQCLHYLLATPFRYPPLKYGSRFGSRREPSLFYGSTGLQPALSESAYYRLVFWEGMKIPPPSGKFITEHTVFGVCIATDQGLRLQDPPFDRFESCLTDPTRYNDTQQLGGQLRRMNIDAFEYVSARDAGGGINMALYTPRPFADTQPAWQQPWLCETRVDAVVFYNQQHGARQFPREQFLVQGKLPIPAS